MPKTKEKKGRNARIMQLRSKGKTPTEIANKVGCSRVRVTQIIAREEKRKKSNVVSDESAGRVDHS